MLKNGPVIFPREKRRDGAGDVTRNDVKEGYLVSLVTSARLFSNEAFDNVIFRPNHVWNITNILVLEIRSVGSGFLIRRFCLKTLYDFFR